jgi:hypothetical protein
MTHLSQNLNILLMPSLIILSPTVILPCSVTIDYYPRLLIPLDGLVIVACLLLDPRFAGSSQTEHGGLLRG